MNKPVRVLIAGANPYNGNKGVAALAYSTIILLDSISHQIGRNIDICVYSHEFKRTFDWIETPEKRIRFQNIYPSDFFGWKKLFGTIISKWRLYNLREFLKSDLILNVTAGDSFSDIYGNHNFRSQNTINRIARKFCKPYIFLPQTYGPFFDNNILEAAIKSLSGAKMVMARDAKSAEFIKKYLPDQKCSSLIDLAFSLPYIKHEMPHDRKNIGINISQTLCSIPKDNKFSITEGYQDLIDALIETLIKNGHRVHLIPHVVNGDANDENEYHLTQKIWEKHKSENLLLAPFFTSPILAKNYISGLDLFIGSRMHACIAAISSGVPTLPLSYSKKFEGLFVNTLGYNYIISLTKGENHVKQIINKTKEMLEDELSIKYEIKLALDQIAQPSLSKIKQNIADVILSISD